MYMPFSNKVVGDAAHAQGAYPHRASKDKNIGYRYVTFMIKTIIYIQVATEQIRSQDHSARGRVLKIVLVGELGYLDYVTLL